MPDKTKFAWSRLLTFTKHAAAYLDRKQGETKFTYALRRVIPQIVALDSEVQTKLADIDIENCVTEKINNTDGVIVRDANGNLKYTAQGLKLCNRQKTDHLNGDNYEIEPYFTRGELPDDLNVDLLLACAGIIFPTEALDEHLSRLEHAARDNNNHLAEQYQAAKTAADNGALAG